MEWLKSIFTVLFVFLVCILVFVLTFLATKMVGKGYSTARLNSGNIKILDRVALGQDKNLLIIQVANKTMLLGVTQQRVEKLCDIDENQLVQIEPSAGNGDFSEILKKTLKNGLNKYGNFGREKGEPHDRFDD